MAEGSITVKLIEDTRQKPPKQRCFNWRKGLDRSPRLAKAFKFILGVFVLAHIISAFSLVLFGKGYETVDMALYILLGLSLELMVLCVVMIGVIAKDILNGSMQMSVWHRSAIGRILRDSFVLLLTSVSILLCINNTENTSDYIIVKSVTRITIPLIILIFISLMKQIYIKGEFSFCWTLILLLMLGEIGVGIAVNDFSLKMNWFYKLSPIAGIWTVLLVFASFYMRTNLFKGAVGIMTSLGILVFTVYKALLLEGIVRDERYYRFSGTMPCLTVLLLSESVGNLVYDIIFGHIETDYFYFLNPPKKENKFKSVTT